MLRIPALLPNIGYDEACNPEHFNRPQDRSGAVLYSELSENRVHVLMVVRPAQTCAHIRIASSPISSTRTRQIRSGVSKIEAPLFYVDDKALLYLAEVLKYRCRNSSHRERQATVSTISWLNLC